MKCFPGVGPELEKYLNQLFAPLISLMKAGSRHTSQTELSGEVSSWKEKEKNHPDEWMLWKACFNTPQTQRNVSLHYKSVLLRNNSDVIKDQRHRCGRTFTCVRWPEKSSSQLAKTLDYVDPLIQLSWKLRKAFSKTFHCSFPPQTHCKCTLKSTCLLLLLVIWWQTAVWLCAPAPPSWFSALSQALLCVPLIKYLYDHDSEWKNQLNKPAPLSISWSKANMASRRSQHPFTELELWMFASSEKCLTAKNF